MNLNAPTSIIEQIADYLIKKTISHIRTAEYLLPLVYELGTELSVIQNTVKHAYPFLNPNKSIDAKRRKGFYIGDKDFFLVLRYVKFKCIDIDVVYFSDSYNLEYFPEEINKYYAEEQEEK